MSQAYMEHEFPLATHPRAAFIKDCIQRCVRVENASLTTNDWDDDEELFLRADTTQVSGELRDADIRLTPAEGVMLDEFAQEYADLREGESYE